ncbi:hypothetical protein ACEPAF_973 [Sanghuangporus sanghuang]
MQPSPKAIEREFEALRDIRRRSSSQGGPGSLILDPDLPAEQPTTAPPPLSPQAWATTNDAASSRSSMREGEDGAPSSVLDDPFHLFWVPAHLHPELAPGEFRAFLKEHAHAAPADGSSGTNLGAALSRASSASSELGRKRSMLSRQYKPRENDGVEEEEKVVPLQRNKSIYTREGPQLTISDLQKLEELADEASKSEDPTKLRRVLRRSLTLNVAPSFLDQMDDVPDTSDDADAPIIVPPPNQILRRTARTKIRKPNLSGDGGGHRFPTARRKSGGGRATSVDQITSPTDGSSSSHGHEAEPAIPLPPISTAPAPTRKRTVELEDQDNRRFTYTEESSIFDAYAESPEDEKSPSPPPASQITARLVVEETTAPVSVPIPILGPAPSSRSSFSEPQISPLEPLASQLQSGPSPILHQPQPQRLLSPQQQQQVLQHPSRSPSPEMASQAQDIQRPDSRSSIKSEAPSIHSVTSTLTDKRKEKDKKSLWRKVGGSSDKSSKKNAREKEKEKDSGFFGSLFGGGKKKQEEQPPTNLGGGAGPATAAALLGASKSNNKAYSPSISPQLGNPYARYPIHVERAIYRLSHIKLANPRRPLYEQVLISNLMFWYLGVINKSNQGPGQNQSQNQNQAPPTQDQAQGGSTSQTTPSQGAGTGQDGSQTAQPVLSEKEQLEREGEQREREERERAEKERAEVKEQQQRREPRRGGLTKPPPAGRRAEMPVKGPQYHLQSQVIEQEYGNGGGGKPGPSPVSRTSSAPPPSMAQSQGYNLNGGYSSRAQSMQPMKSQQLPPQQMYSQPNGNSNYYYGRSASVDFSASGVSSASSSTNLPPGAMAPTDPTWLASAQVVGGTLPARAQPPSHGYAQNADYAYNQQSPRTSRSPPANTSMNTAYDWNRNGELPLGGKAPSRSLSANAAAPAATQNRQYDQYGQYGQPPQPPHGGLKKKVASASAVAPDRDKRQQRTSDDEDVPLAMWHQRRK